MKLAFMLALFTLPALFCNSAKADLVISADSNIGNALNGSSGATYNPGNATFFRDLLKGSSTVVLEPMRNGDPTVEASWQGVLNYYVNAGDTVIVADAVAIPDILPHASLLIAMMPEAWQCGLNYEYCAPEFTAVRNFLTAGGTVFVTVDDGAFDTWGTIGTNQFLQFIGSSMSVGYSCHDGKDYWCGGHDYYTGDFTTATAGQILATPYTAGVTSFEYGVTGNIVGGTPIFLTKDGAVFMAYTASVPEPSSACLLITMILGVSWAVRKRTSGRKEC